MLKERKPVEVLTTPVLWECFCTLDTATQTYLLQLINVQDTTILQNSHTKMPLKELGIISGER